MGLWAGGLGGWARGWRRGEVVLSGSGVGDSGVGPWYLYPMVRRGSTPVLPLTGNHLCQNLRDYFGMCIFICLLNRRCSITRERRGKCDELLVAGGRAANQKLMARGMSDTSMSVKYFLKNGQHIPATFVRELE